jgi:hypothetical protein
MTSGGPVGPGGAAGLSQKIKPRAMRGVCMDKGSPKLTESVERQFPVSTVLLAHNYQALNRPTVAMVPANQRARLIARRRHLSQKRKTRPVSPGGPAGPLRCGVSENADASSVCCWPSPPAATWRPVRSPPALPNLGPVAASWPVLTRPRPASEIVLPAPPSWRWRHQGRFLGSWWGFHKRFGQTMLSVGDRHTMT